MKEIKAEEIAQVCRHLAAAIAAAHTPGEPLCFVGITNGGIELSRRLAQLVGEELGQPLPCGQVNATFHRDDIGTNPIPQPKERTELPFDVTGTHIILVDDVIATGRTVRAALNELFDAGRPARVELAVLCDPGGRKLPITPNYLGFADKILSARKIRVMLDPENPARDRIESAD